MNPKINMALKATKFQMRPKKLAEVKVEDQVRTWNIVRGDLVRWRRLRRRRRVF